MKKSIELLRGELKFSFLPGEEYGMFHSRYINGDICNVEVNIESIRDLRDFFNEYLEEKDALWKYHVDKWEEDEKYIDFED